MCIWHLLLLFFPDVVKRPDNEELKRLSLKTVKDKNWCICPKCSRVIDKIVNTYNDIRIKYSETYAIHTFFFLIGWMSAYKMYLWFEYVKFCFMDFFKDIF